MRPNYIKVFFWVYFSKQNAKETPWHRSVPGGTQYRYRSRWSSYQPVLYNDVLGITKDFLQPGRNYNKMYGTEPRCNEPQFNEILVITNTIQKRRRIVMNMPRCNEYVNMWPKDSLRMRSRSTRIKFWCTVVLSSFFWPVLAFLVQ